MDSFVTILKECQKNVEEMKYEDAYNKLITLQEDVTGFYAMGSLEQFVYYNNMGLICHKRGLHYSSFFYYNKALKIFKELREKYANAPPLTDVKDDNKDPKPKVLDLKYKAHFMYNYGVSCLFTNRASEAFECLLEAVQMFPLSPMVWLRLAECGTKVYKCDNNKNLLNFSQRRHELATKKVGTEKTYRIILNNKVYQDSAYSCEPQSSAMPGPTLPFANMCITNALHLLDRKTIEENEENDKLRHKVLAVSVYIKLTIGEPAIALEHCNRLLEDQYITDRIKYLGQLYKAEALLMLNKVTDSLEIFEGLLKQFKNKQIDVSEIDTVGQEWYPKTEKGSQTVVQYNLAAALTMKGEFNKAADILKVLWSKIEGPNDEVPLHVVALAMYIELKQGKTDSVQTILNTYCSHLFVQ